MSASTTTGTDRTRADIVANDNAPPSSTSQNPHHHNGGGGGGGGALPPDLSWTVPPTIPDVLTFHRNPDEDDMGYKAPWEAISNPLIYHYIRHSIRSTAFVALPLLTIAIHPNTMFDLGMPNMLVAAVLAFSMHRPSLGEQIGVVSLVLPAFAYQLIVGQFATSTHTYDHLGAWYGVIAVSIFIPSFISHAFLRRFFYLYIFLYMMVMRTEYHVVGAVRDASAGWFTADLCIGVSLGTAATLFPYPVLTHRLMDTLMEKLFTGLARVVTGMHTYIFLPDAHAASIFFTDYSPFESLEGGLAMMPIVLWFVNWEPTEYTLRNPIRRLKFALMKRILALAYAAFECGRNIANIKKIIAEQKATEDMYTQLKKRCEEDDDKAKQQQQKQQGNGKEKGKGGGGSKSQHEFDEEGRRTLEQNTAEHAKDFAATLMKAIIAIGTGGNTPRELLKNVPFAELSAAETSMRRNFRMEMAELMHLQRQAVQQNSEEKKKDKNGPSSSSSSPSRDPNTSSSSNNEPYGRGDTLTAADAPAEGQLARDQWLNHLSADEARRLVDYQETLGDLGILLRLNLIYFCVIMGLITDELHSFGEMLKTYRPAKSTGRRLFEDLLQYPWLNFWSSLWDQLIFRTPQNVRMLKDAVKMVLAYLVACAMNFEIFVPEGGWYFFGVTTILGLPVEEETVTLCICRIGGNTLGCALGYLAFYNTQNFAQQIATTMCFAFLLRCFQHHKVVGDAFFYGAVITLAGLPTALEPLEMLVRLMAGVYAAGGYTLCCMLIFPVSPVKVLWGYRMKLSKVLSELLDDVAITARIPLDGTVAAINNNNNNNNSSSEPYGNATREDGSREAYSDAAGGGRREGDEVAVPMLANMSLAEREGYAASMSAHMCGQMALQVHVLKRMLVMCAKWTPFAAKHPFIRGTQPFPAAASENIHSGHRRLTASVQLLVFGMELLHRPREEAAHPQMQRLLAGPIAEFLRDLSDAVRLLCQDYIDSVQASRAFSYPKYLSHVSYLARMRTRLRAISYEAYVLISERAAEAAGGDGGGGGGMTATDYDDLREEQRRRREAADRRRQEEGSGSNSTAVDVHVDNDGNINDGNAEGDQATTADRLLLRNMPDHHRSTVTSPQERNDDDGLSPGDGGVGGGSFVRRGAYSFRAPLHEEHGETQMAYPAAPEDPERTVNDELRRRERREARRREDGGDVASEHVPTSARSLRTPQHQQQLSPMPPSRHPSRLGRAMSVLIAPAPEDPHAQFCPTYTGPSFSYHEDALELPIDTDFSALVILFSSCEAIMTEMERAAPAVNEVSKHDKQLKETTFLLPLLDKFTAVANAHREGIHSRYHNPPAAAAEEGPPLCAVRHL